MSPLAERDRAEIERSAEEALQITIRPPNRSELKRYLDPPSDTAFPLEYAYWLLGDVRGKRLYLTLDVAVERTSCLWWSVALV